MANIHAFKPAPQVVTTAYGEAPAPFFHLQRGVVREWATMGLSPGGLHLFGGMSSRVFGADRLASTPPEGWARFIGRPRNTVWRAQQELTTAGLIERVDENQWRLIDEGALFARAARAAADAGHDQVREGRADWITQATKPVRLALDWLEGLNGSALLLWVNLQSFTKPASRDPTFAYPGVKRLAECMGTGRRAVERQLAELKRRGRITPRRPGRGWYVLPPQPDIDGVPKRPGKGEAPVPKRPDKVENSECSKMTGQGESAKVFHFDRAGVPKASQTRSKSAGLGTIEGREEERVARETAEHPPAKPAPAEPAPSLSFYDQMVQELGIWPPTADAIAGEWALSPQYLGNRAKVRDPIDFLKDPDKRQRVLDGAYRDRQFADRPKPVQRCRIRLTDGTVIAADRPTWLRLILTGKLTKAEFDRCRAFGWGREEDWQRNLFVRREAERVERERLAAERAEAEARGDAPWLTFGRDG